MKYGRFLSDETPSQRWDRENYWDRLEAARSGNAIESPRRAADRRAKEFFEASLTPEQLSMFQREKRFFVVGGASFAIYELKNFHSFNIKNIATGDCYCGGPEDVPQFDRLASQKMWLESDEELMFLSKCNKMHTDQFPWRR